MSKLHAATNMLSSPVGVGISVQVYIRCEPAKGFVCHVLASPRPRVWLQMSTATIYAHRFDAANDEATGRIGGDEPDAPAYWKFSVEIARAWEHALAEASTPRTRRVALRSAIVMAPERGGP